MIFSIVFNVVVIITQDNTKTIQSRDTMSDHIELSKVRAKKLVEAWEGHIKNDTSCDSCTSKTAKCPIHKYFMELKRKV